MIKDYIYKILEEFDTGEEFQYYIGDKEAPIEIEKMLKEKDIEYQLSADEMFESCGYTVWSLSIAYIENGKLELIVEQLVMN